MYKLANNSMGQTIILKTDGVTLTSFLEDPANTDFLQYQKWLSEGNVPLPPDEPTLPETV
jgi:sulfur relay (sulfurtransferase) complex TusBCD TusD component (DsrE family)